MNKKICSTIVPQVTTQTKHSQQLCLALESPGTKPEKLQIASVPDVSPKERNRYRVTLGDRVLGDRLSVDEALELVKRGGR